MTQSHTSPRFTGVVPPVVTPFTPEGEVDHESLAGVVEMLITGGVAGLFALGSTGETAYLTEAQRVAVLETIVRANAGRVPVIAGAIELTAPRIIETAQKLVAAGADAIVTTAPLYTLNSQAEIGRHFRLIAAAIDAPLWAYDVPVRVHTKLSIELLLDLAADGVIHGLKDSSGDDVAFRRLVAANRAAGSPLQLLTGHELVVDAMLLAGADGVVPGFANVDVEGYVRLFEAAARGDFDAARDAQERLNERFELVFAPRGYSGDAMGVGAFKVAMQARGFIAHAGMAVTVEPLAADAIAEVRAIAERTGLAAAPARA
ncbi:dihydrodipicolinate synthase family protein [Leucobacter aridicollis]|uniref:4-hydroxy-tetrahydrodipicolinate synthase n=1 Tax=Leucobacter aridicollis TaxID=283878 RepID=A0A852R0S1_9MICO|nr:dihydrodipicolinate synthase family protein [Leucobacter aridicollis]MBL3683634.1 dihydrodipicolinate synthase family protein [Leucobacter aridicollis]NYD28313.1 4-hydroxy-tetrahydrodipicolinate synthase [Leucobacter aridicollis]